MRLTADILKLAFYPGEAQILARYTDCTRTTVFESLFPKSADGVYLAKNGVQPNEYLKAVGAIHVARNLFIVGVALVAFAALAATYGPTVHPIVLVYGAAASVTVAILGAVFLFKELSTVDQVLQLSEPNNIMHSADYLALRA